MSKKKDYVLSVVVPIQPEDDEYCGEGCLWRDEYVCRLFAYALTTDVLMTPCICCGQNVEERKYVRNEVCKQYACLVREE